MRNFSYRTSLWLILLFKNLNTLVIEHQPGSPCAGDIFANVYNIKLSFWLTEMNINENTALSNLRKSIDKQIENITEIRAISTKELNNFTLLFENLDKSNSPWMKLLNESEENNAKTKSGLESILKDMNKMWDISNKIEENDPTLIWESEWLCRISWKTPFYIDVIGKTISGQPCTYFQKHNFESDPFTHFSSI